MLSATETITSPAHIAEIGLNAGITDGIMVISVTQVLTFPQLSLTVQVIDETPN